MSELHLPNRIRQLAVSQPSAPAVTAEGTTLTYAEFDSYTMHIHKATFIPVKVEYEKGGSVYRVGEALKVEDIQGFKTVTQSRMTDQNTGTETTLEYLKVEYDLGLKDEIFTERFMRRPPKEYLN